MSKCQEAALYYAERGFSVLPLRKDKKPFLEWTEYQKRRASKDEINAWFEKWPKANVGIVTGKISDVVVIDIDDDWGETAVEKYIDDAALPPTVKTPSGGKHLYFKAPSIHMSNNAKVIPGCDFRGDGGYVVAPPSIGETGEWEWLYGLDIHQVTELPILPEAYIQAVSPNIRKAKAQTGNATDMFKRGRRDEDLFHTANTLIKGGMYPDRAAEVLRRLLQSWGETDEKWIQQKIDSALNRADVRERNISNEVREYVSNTTGSFAMADVTRDLELQGRDAKKVASVIISTLIKDGVLERWTSKNGVYRLVEPDADELDWKNASLGNILDVQYPFSLHKLIVTMPKNVMVVSGEPNAGKTAFLLNFALMNLGKFKVHYFSSEMGPLELKNRLVKFEGVPIETWHSVDFRERSEAFGDVIHPNDINVIDFLEIHDEFYKIGLLLKQVYDKLDGGMAMVGVQKNPGTDFGLGGSRGMEKPRLYLAMESGLIKIIKAKNWATDNWNPNGLIKPFKLVQGWKFIEEEKWMKGESK